MFDSGKTKLAIFETAATLFAQEGYDKVSMKQIAQAVGITPPSIYNHFTSKNAILMSLYSYLDETNRRLKPNLNEILRLCETAHPHDIMRMTVFTYPEEIMHLMSCATMVIISMMRTDPRADSIAYRNLIQMSYEYDIPILNRLQELGRIEPIDAERFALIHSCYSFSVAIRFSTPHSVEADNWNDGLELLFQLIRPTSLVKETAALT